MWTTIMKAGLLAATLLLPLAAEAGQSCNEKPLSEATLSKALTTAQNVQAELNESGSDVAILGRVGQDLSEYGLHYSHVGIAFRAGTEQPWHVLELLNQCGTANSDLWADGLGNFFMDDMFSFDAIILVPPPELRQRLTDRLRNTTQLRQLYEPKYNMVAYPFSVKYQNSNQWVLENLAAAESRDMRIITREQAQAWLKMVGYQPTEMHVGPLKRLGGRMFKANVAFDDHPNELRYSDRINAVTVDSIVDFLRKRNEGWRAIEIRSSP
ncbi:MAG TPA: DUF2145 domain-containing protein [Burkholderiaceae bacterium]|nr:DUF2145 domain-containing protein [Burkholderiaceae bacterium]